MRNTRCMIYCVIAALLLAVCATAEELSDGISGFRVPEYDAQGEMTSQLFGDHAEMQGGGKVKITGVRMDFYRDGETFMTVKSPYCFFNQRTGKAHSEAPVAADMDGIRIRGRGFKLQSAERTVQILNDSKVIIDDVMQQTETDPPVEQTDTNQVTVITSTRLFMNYNERKVRFEENVHVLDPQMEMDCDTMNVRFSENNEIDWIEALANVKLFSEGREAHAGRAVYDATTEEFLLEESPRILEGRNLLLGERIRFWRATGRMICEPAARLIIYSDGERETNILGN